MDPVETKNQKYLEKKEMLGKVLAEVDSRLEFHDFRMVDGKEQINLIFDMVVPHEYDKEKQIELKRCLREQLGKVDQRYQCVITTERSYVANAKE